MKIHFAVKTWNKIKLLKNNCICLTKIYEFGKFISDPIRVSARWPFSTS